ncbi:hypothetical protein HaLaN_32515, partial [Haematococcus lacustris]
MATSPQSAEVKHAKGGRCDARPDSAVTRPEEILNISAYHVQAIPASRIGPSVALGSVQSTWWGALYPVHIAKLVMAVVLTFLPLASDAADDA